jgi:GMP synthase-like glutamine amidotransferase
LRILEVLHGKPECSYNNAGFFQRRGDDLAVADFSRGIKPPALPGFDAAIVYGGYMSAYDDAASPWLADELRFLESCLGAGKRVLGICLGSQLLARLLGARVYRSPSPEFGFKRIELTDEGRADPVLGRLARSGEGAFLGLEWHDDAWDLPAGATLLARSPGWENQAFRYGDQVLATQFHLEFTQEHMARAVAAQGGKFPADPDGEPPEAFVATGPKWNEIQRTMEALLDGFLDHPV